MNFRIFASLIIFLNSIGSFAANDAPTVYEPTTATNANLIFSGIAKNDFGDSFGYVFKLNREQEKLHISILIVDTENKQIYNFDDKELDGLPNNPKSFKVGRAFINYNPINETWIFGVKSKKGKGLNFKVDMLNSVEDYFKREQLRPGVDILIGQTGRLNGHIYALAKPDEQFVTASHSWFTELWQSGELKEPHHVTSLTCRFIDNTGFYGVNLMETDALRGSLAAKYDEDGKKSNISQFISMKQLEDNSWKIHVPTPRYDLYLKDLFKKGHIAAGFVKHNNKLGFCVISKDTL